MKYKNVSGGHLQVAENRFLDPNAEIELDEDDLKTPMIKAAVKQKGWLTPVIQDIEQEFIQGEINHITGNTQPITNDINININIPIKGKNPKAQAAPAPAVDVSSEIRQKAIADALAKTAQDKRNRGWNPMDDAAYEDEDFGDYLGPQEYLRVNSKTDYGNAELSQDPLPTVNAGADGIGQVGYLLHHPDDIRKAQQASAPMKQKPTAEVVEKAVTKASPKAKNKKPPQK